MRLRNLRADRLKHNPQRGIYAALSLLVSNFAAAQQPAGNTPETQPPVNAAAAGAQQSPAPEHQIVANEVAGFSVYSYDTKSAAFVADAGEKLVGFFERLTRTPNAHRGKNVRVELVPRVIAKFPEPSRLTDNDGQITLHVRWGKNTDRGELFRGLARAYLARVAQNAGIAQPASKIPEWLVAALALETEAELTPALLEQWKREAARAPIPPLEKFSDETPLNDNDRLAAFWFWRHLRRKLGTGIVQGQMLLALAGGESLDAFLGKKFPDVWKDDDRKATWWPTSFTLLIRERLAPTLTMRESREFLEKAADFVFAPDGKDKRLDPLALIELREQPAVRREVFERRQNLRIEIARANPVWHNAWRAYGVFLEKFDDEKTTAEELKKLWQIARAEAAVAAVLETEARAALRR